MLRHLSVLSVLATAELVNGLGEMEVAWASNAPEVDDDSAEVLNMVCYPTLSSCQDPTAVWAVHTVDRDGNGQTSVNTESYPSWGLPAAFRLGDCVSQQQVPYSPATETFSQTFISTKDSVNNELKGTDVNTEIGGEPFTSQTKLIRRTDVKLDGVQGLFATHDTFELSDNWNLADKKTPWDIPYGDSDK